MYTYHGSTYVDNYLKIFKNSSFLGGYIKNEGEGRISWFTVVYLRHLGGRRSNQISTWFPSTPCLKSISIAKHEGWALDFSKYCCAQIKIVFEREKV